MIDTSFRDPYQKIIDPLARKLRLSPSFITLLALLTGLSILPLLYCHKNGLAFLMLAVTGFFDTLDGSIARMQNRCSNKGSVFDIFSDRCVEVAIVIGLFLRHPSESAICLMMLASMLLCITSFLVVGIFTENNAEKSFHYSPGLIERAEAFLFFAWMILFPRTFVWVGTLFSLLVFYTGVRRIIDFFRKG